MTECKVCTNAPVAAAAFAYRAAGMGPTKIRAALIADGQIVESDLTVRNIDYHVTHCQGREAETANRAMLELVAGLIAKSGIDLGDVGRIEKIRKSQWQSITKDADGEAQIHDLEGGAIVLTPTWDTGPKWPVVQPAAPVKLPAGKPSAAKRRKADKWKTAVILPDVQIGFHRDLEDPSIVTPFHDERAMDVALQITGLLAPDLIVNLGDFLDFAEFSRFLKEPSFALTTQAALNRGHLFLAEQRAIAPLAEIRLIEGNHDLRLNTHIKTNAIAAFGLKQANAPESWPVMSVQHLLRLDELGVTYIPGYPAGITWINDRLACVHGSKVRSNGSSAAAVIDDERVSTIFGHVHRIETQYKTRRTREGGRVNFAASPGCLCRIDGRVPGTMTGSDESNRPVDSTPNWQQGMGVVTYQEGDAPFSYEPVFIHEGTAIFRGGQVSARTNTEHRGAA